MPSSFTETGSAHLHRKTFFNSGKELDLDIPDGDVDVGKQVYNVHCVGCHVLFENSFFGPKLHNIFGKTAATQREFTRYSLRLKGIKYQWSKERLYYLIENPEEVLGLDSYMTFVGLEDRYERACLIEFLHYTKIHTSKVIKPEWVAK